MNTSTRVILALAIGVTLGGASALTVLDVEADTVERAPANSAPEAFEPTQTPIPGADPICASDLDDQNNALRKLTREARDHRDAIDVLHEQLVRRGLAEPDGTPMRWYEGIDADSNAAVIDDWIERLDADCPGLLTEDRQTRCDEFPCFASITVDKAKLGERRVTEACPTLQEVVDNGATAFVLEIAEFYALGPKRARLIFQPYPSDEDDSDLYDHLEAFEGNIDKRRRHRDTTIEQRELAERLEAACSDTNTIACLNAKDLLTSMGEDDRAAVMKKRAYVRGKNNVLAALSCYGENEQEAKLLFRRSCDEGIEENCGRECKPGEERSR